MVHEFQQPIAPSFKGFTFLVLSWTLHIVFVQTLGVRLMGIPDLFRHVSFQDIMATLSGLGSITLTVLGSIHYLLKIREAREAAKKRKDEKCKGKDDDEEDD